MATALAAITTLYIFLISKTDVIVVRFIKYKKQADFLLNPPIILVLPRNFLATVSAR